MLPVSQSEGEGSPTSEAGKQKIRKRRRVKRKVEGRLPQNFEEIPGIFKLVISKFTQNQIECIVGEDVYAEQCWKSVPKENFEENFEMVGDDSDFMEVKDSVLKYPRPELLLGYIPHEVRPYDEFYICTTPETEDAVLDLIERKRKQQEDRLNKSIHKEPRPWLSYGSEKEIEEITEKANRPLLEVEVETEYPIFTSNCRYSLRVVEQARDGYAEILTTRYVYDNVVKKQIDAQVQVTPYVWENHAQTFQTYPRNQWTQYEYSYKEITDFSKEFEDNMKSFVENEIDRFDDRIYVNSCIDFYKDDYKCLAKTTRPLPPSLASSLKEFTALADVNVCKDKRITALCWHPMWTGTIAIAYGNYSISQYLHSRPTHDDVMNIMYHNIPVLIWSFADTLNARLFLETPREVTVLSFCPYYDNLLIGGLSNGQVVIWDIKGKLEKVEKIEYLTPAQQRYRILMNSLVRWMKNTKNPKVVRVTAISDIEYSHRSAVMGIRWISPYRELSKSGKFLDIPPEEDRTSLNFVTCARDGTLLLWDMLQKPIYTIGGYKPHKKLKRLKEKPAALVEEVSPLKEINRIFKPKFKIILLAPNTSRQLPLTGLSFGAPPCTYEEVSPDPKRPFNIAERVKYKPNLLRTKKIGLNEFVTGTTEGDFIVGTWDGFEFNAGEVVNKEIGKIANIGKYHDGPVVGISRSMLFGDIVLTVGGKMFCLWKTDFIGKPFFCRRGKHRYTHCTWNSYRPSLFRLAREDGQVELWHLGLRSDTYIEIKSVSGKSLGGTYTHPRSMEQNVMGMSDDNGFFRLFYVAQRLNVPSKIEKELTYKFYIREVTRKKNFLKWQEEWTAKNAQWVKEKRQEEELKIKLREEEDRREKHQLLEEKEFLEKEEANRIARIAEPEPGKYAEWAFQQWKMKEEERMNKVLLGKKALDINLLEKQQLPLAKLSEEEEKKKWKVKQRLQHAEKIFEEAVSALFPDAVKQKLPPPPDPYAGGDPMDVKVGHFDLYKKIENECDSYIEENPHVDRFSWMHAIQSGKDRRMILDGYYSRVSHKQRLIRDKEREVREAKEATAAAKKAKEKAAEEKKEESELDIIVEELVPEVEAEESQMIVYEEGH